MDQVDFGAVAVALGFVLIIFFGPKSPREIADEVAKALRRLSDADATFVPLDQAVIDRMTIAAVVGAVLFLVLMFLAAQY